jgi:hypothetical protein
VDAEPTVAGAGGDPASDEAPDDPAGSAEADAAVLAAVAKGREQPAGGRVQPRRLGARRTRTVGDRLALPPVVPHFAAMIAGAVAGLFAVMGGFVAESGCDAISGSSGCGGGLGLLALVVILVLEVLVGARLLQLWRITDPYSTSFLGVGLVAMVAMLIFLEAIDSAWMLLVIPVLTALAFLLSWWVTVRFVEEPDRR